MPNATTHRAHSTVAGAAVGLYLARDQAPDGALARLLVAVVAAQFGGALPDILEPGLHSWHRQTAHSLAAGGGLTWLGLAPTGGLREKLGQWDLSARQLRGRRLALPPEHADRPKLWLQELAYHALIAGSYGLAVGYVTHLAADAGTPRGLPLL